MRTPTAAPAAREQHAPAAEQQEEQQPPQRSCRFVCVAGGVRLHVTTAGSPAAPAVLLLHGFPDSAALWEGVLTALSRRFFCVAPDLHGLGRSDRPAALAAYRLPAVAAALVELLDALQLRRAAVVGHDWGAAAAWALTLAAPERVSRLAALSVGHPGGGAAVDPGQRPRWWYMLLFAAPGAEDALAARDWALLREVLRPGCSPGQVQRYVHDLRQPGALSGALNWYRANTSARTFGRTQPWLRHVGRVRVPVLGVWSSGDKALGEAQMLASARWCDDWTYARLEGAGHWMMRDAPTELNDLLLRWLGDGDGDGDGSGRDGGTGGAGRLPSGARQPLAKL
ncbi:yfhM [Scenedesmus sp. PABB004]|nr:yfhM [Scenedesmus sp. PABB004]